LLERHYIELQMLEILISRPQNDEEIVNLLLDRFNEVKKVIERLEKEVKNDKNK
jgi:hypothetical protein